MRSAAAVALGGALGAVARWALTTWVHAAVGTGFPWGTAAVNVAGSFALGFLVVGLEPAGSSSALRHFLAIGVLGSFTTFSAFSYETLALLREGQAGRAGAYALGSLAVGVGAALLGMLVAGARAAP